MILRQVTALNFGPVKWAILAVLVVACASCTRFVPRELTVEEVSTPSAFTLYDDTAPAPSRWWEAFGSEELNRLVLEALQDSLTLRQVRERLVQAEMVARQANASLYPDLNFSASTAATRRRTDTGESASKIDLAQSKIAALNTLLGLNPPTDLADALQTARTGLQAVQTLGADTPSSAKTSTSHNYGLGLSGQYDLDLWGGARARRRAAALDYQVAHEQLYGAMLNLSGAVVQQWLVVAAQQEGLDLVHEQLASNKTALELMELRYRKGLATALDVFQQRQIVAQTESLVPPLEAAIQTARHELAVLLGRAPREDIGIETVALPPDIPSLPDPGLPADLLAQRPDVRAAGLGLRAADWRFAAARADRLPALRLTASAGYDADTWALVFDNWAATLAASLTGPVFDAGRRKAEVERTRAVAGERLAFYQESVLNGIKDVENALLRETKQVEYINALERENEAVRMSYEQAQERYRKGLNDYLPVLSALTQLQVLERSLVVARFNRLIDRVDLSLALGGAWMAEITETTSEKGSD